MTDVAGPEVAQAASRIPSMARCAGSVSWTRCNMAEMLRSAIQSASNSRASAKQLVAAC